MSSSAKKYRWWGSEENMKIASRKGCDFYFFRRLAFFREEAREESGGRTVSGEREEDEHAANEEGAVGEVWMEGEREESEEGGQATTEGEDRAFDRPSGNIHSVHSELMMRDVILLAFAHPTSASARRRSTPGERPGV